jgi:hypothetical protein
MKAKSGYETNGDYIKYKSGFTSYYMVETEGGVEAFKEEYDADMYIITKVVGCEKAYPTCDHYKSQQHGCYNCSYGRNANCAR